ncbi:RNA polymerase II transcription factor B subunit 4 [Dimargaris verticillata]|uniref:General transcription and DNA repair factor IIH subunit TFB4 n=1 Tax=Dimargaris verticillata TaxID=2761393 RepID=A0A9W8EFE8_9FUNG|nr:RNA polymerase II transcription factor B subunit 4 [Dimargaris verticillata]
MGHTDASLADDAPSLLVVILDANPLAWARSPVAFVDALKQIIVFLHAYLALKHDNQLAVIASTASACHYLYSLAPTEAPVTSTTAAAAQDGNLYQRFKHVDEQILTNAQRVVHDAAQQSPLASTDAQTSVRLSNALSQALCYIGRHTRAEAPATTLQPRILVLTVSDDSSQQYIQVMNCIFACQKLTIPLDACKITGSDSGFLQQAASLTQGLYVKLDHPSGLLEYLMLSFLTDTVSRRILVAPQQRRVDFRAACFCHKKVVDIGYVCSVCLSIFCAFSPVCSTCRTKFAFTHMAFNGRGGRFMRGRGRSSLRIAQSSATTPSLAESNVSTTSPLPASTS